MDDLIKIMLLGTLIICSCNHKEKLPIYGNRYADTRLVDGREITDTIYETVPDFKLINQNGDTVTKMLTDNKIYVADFFFTTCPTICPVMKREMIRVYEKFKNDPGIMILSHTIDPEHDNVRVLKEYSSALGSDGIKWQFLTGNRDSIYTLAEKGYYASARVDSLEPGGFVHSGGFILVDKQRRVRGIYDGTNTGEVNKLLEDINILSHETD